MTPFLQSIDPDGRHHHEMGAVAARFAFERYPLGELPPAFVTELEAMASSQMKQTLASLGAEQGDIVIAFRWVADEFARAYEAMVDEFASRAGHA